MRPTKSRTWFTRLAKWTARVSGRPSTFFLASAAIITWAVLGPYFGFSDTWQLVINTSTTIVTFLMVFLIQHTQNLDTLALQLKLAELILVMEGAEPKMALAEDLSHEDLEGLREKLRQRTEQSE